MQYAGLAQVVDQICGHKQPLSGSMSERKLAASARRIEIATPLPNGMQPSWLSDFISWPVVSAGRGVLAFGPIARGRAQQQLAGVYVVSLLYGNVLAGNMNIT